MLRRLWASPTKTNVHASDGYTPMSSAYVELHVETPELVLPEEEGALVQTETRAEEQWPEPQAGESRAVPSRSPRPDT